MSPDEFVTLVAELRESQRSWFGKTKTRTPGDFERTKSLQSRVDVAITAMGGMDGSAFVVLVAMMRGAQRTWFNPRTRTDSGLKEAKRLERAVDAAIAEIQDQQLTLFGPTEG